jgi:ComF family protein
MFSVSRPADALIAALLAPGCVSCSTVLDTPTVSPVCEQCWRNLRRIAPPVCETCGEPMAATHVDCPLAGTALRALRALGPYEGVLRDLVHAIKFDRRRSLVAPLAAELGPLAADVMASVDALVPVPLHPFRFWSRGFNQADDLARALAKGERPVMHALRRARATRPQSSLDAGARYDNVRDAFRVSGWTERGRRRWRERIAGRTLLLVDDVTTTGATLDEGARVLLEAGAAEVRAVTLARVERSPR